MTDLEHDLYQNLDMTWNGWETEINYESSAKNFKKVAAVLLPQFLPGAQFI